MGRIRKDDLDAVGEMAGLVGAFMTDFAQKTPSDSRHNLFKRGINPRETLVKAVMEPQDDEARRLVPDNASIEQLPVKPLVEYVEPPPQQVTPQQQQELRMAVPITVPPPRPPQSVPGVEQLEFNFMDRRIEGIGSVRDVVTHFNSRLDKIEESISLIKSFMVEIRANMPKKRKNTNEA